MIRPLNYLPLRSRRPSRASVGEEDLARQLRAAGRRFEREFRFHPKRLWRSDFRIFGPSSELLVEVEGMPGRAFGRHQRRLGLERDCEKYAEAACHGWIVLRVTRAQVADGRALEWIGRILDGG